VAGKWESDLVRVRDGSFYTFFKPVRFVRYNRFKLF
jgi:hypothetical protein